MFFDFASFRSWVSARACDRRGRRSPRSAKKPRFRPEIVILEDRTCPSTIVNFDAINALPFSDGVGGTTLANYLAGYGMSISNVTPGTSVVVMDYRNEYGGQATIPPSLPNLLTQVGVNGPVSFEVDFAAPQDSFSFTRCSLIAGPYGVPTHPQWDAFAIDATGHELDHVGEGFIASFSPVPAATYTLRGPGITSVEFASNNFDSSPFGGVLLDDFVLNNTDKLMVTTQPPSQVVAGTPFDVQISAEDANGNGDPDFTGPVTVALANNPGNATLGGTLTVNAVNGVADFPDLTLDQPGTGYTLQATSTGLSAVTTAPFDVVVDKLVVTSQPPSQVVAGSPFDVQVSAEDANGNVDPNFSGSVTLALANNPGGSRFGGTLTVKAVNGIADFPHLTLDRPGTGYTLQATSGTLTPAVTHRFDVTGADIVIDSVETQDSRELTVDYDVKGADLTEPLTIGFFRSTNSAYDPGTAQPLVVSGNGSQPGGITINPGDDTTVGHHSVSVDLPGGLTPDTASPYVLAVADPDKQLTDVQIDTGTAFFRSYVIGAVVPGFQAGQLVQYLVGQYGAYLAPYAPDLTLLSQIISSLPTGTPDWENQIAQDMTAAGYDKVIPFSWDTGTPSPASIYQGAHDLFNQIVAAAQAIPNLQPNDVIDVHLAAHSRGCPLSGLAMEEIISSAPLPQLQHGYLKMTLMDPHPANNDYGVNADFGPDFLGLVTLAVYTKFQSLTKDPPVIVPPRVNAAEELWQKTPTSEFTDLIGSRLLNLWGLDPGRLVQDYSQPPVGANETAPGLGHTEIQQLYIDKATPSFLASGKLFPAPVLSPTPGYYGPANVSFTIMPDSLAEADGLLLFVNNALIDQPTPVIVNVYLAPGVVPDLPVSPPANVTVNLHAQAATAADAKAFLSYVDHVLGPQSTPTRVILDLLGGSYPDLTASPPSGVTLVIAGQGSLVTIVGHSPALTVNSGNVVVTGLTLTTATDSPTVLVTGGHLTLRNDDIEESTRCRAAAIAATGGTVDLGTAADPGGNTFNVNGRGNFIANTGPNPVLTIGDTFEINGTALDATKLKGDFRIANHIFDALDEDGGGLVTFVAGNAFVTRQGGSIQRAVDAVPAGYTINVQSGGDYCDYTVGAKLLTIAFQDGPALALQQDLPNGLTTLRVTGTPCFNDIDFRPGRAGAIQVEIDDLPTGSFAATGRIVAHGGGDGADIRVSRRIDLLALLFADGANGHLRGGGGPTVEVGAGGNDTELEAGRGRSLLIGGKGKARLDGGGADAILIGGTTDYDRNEAALMALINEWDHTYDAADPLHDYQIRVAHLLTGGGLNVLNGVPILLDAQTVHDNGRRDDLDGGAGRDLFFAALSRRHKDHLDDVRRGDVVIDISAPPG